MKNKIYCNVCNDFILEEDTENTSDGGAICDECGEKLMCPRQCGEMYIRGYYICQNCGWDISTNTDEH